MTTDELTLEDLILSSRSLALEEKQELLKLLDTFSPEKKAKMREILEREFQSFRKLDQLALSAIQQFTVTLKTVTETITA